MNKEKIDEFINILKKIDEDAKSIKSLFEFCNNEELKTKMINMIDEIFEGTVEVEDDKFVEDFNDISQQVMQNIHSQVPEELLNYYCIEIYCIGKEDMVFFEDEQKAIFEKWIEETINSTDEENKINIIKKLLPQKECYAAEILKSLSNLKKVEIVSLFKHDCYKMQILEELNESEKIKLLLDLDFELYKVEVIKTLSDSQKIKLLPFIKDNNSKKRVIETINDEGERQKARLEYVESDIQKTHIIAALDMFEGKDWTKAVLSLPDEYKIKILKDLDENIKWNIIQTIKNSEVMQNALDMLENKQQGQLLKRLYEKNNDIVKNIDLRILDKKYLDTLGEEKINLITCYPEVQQKILTLTEGQYRVFEKCLNNYLKKNNETDEWTVVAESILENFINGQYLELINNINNIEELDVEKLTKLLQLSNDLELRTVEDVKNYDEIKRQKCDEIINGNTDIKEKKKAVFLKLFGQDLQYIETIIKKYGEDIKNLEDCDEKYYVMAIKQLMEVTDENLLKQIYNECEEVGIVDKAYTERALKTAYGKMFNEGLYEKSDEKVLEENEVPEGLEDLGVKVYNAGTDFKMIITSVAPFVSNHPEDFKKDWNRPTIASQHFCASYIRSDMIGTPPIPHLCYGFSEMKEDALMLSGARDIFSTKTGIVSSALYGEEYYSPDEQINRTTHNYNEMDFRRIQGGEKKQPDYIVAFKRNGKIDNIDKIRKAVQDWGQDLPIVIVDIDECLKQQRQQVDNLLKEYNANKSPEKARELLQKVRNNRMTDQVFCQDVQTQLTQIENESGVKLETAIEPVEHPKSEVGKDELKGNSQMVTSEERKEGMGIMRETFTKIQQIAENKKEEEIQQ